MIRRLLAATLVIAAPLAPASAGSRYLVRAAAAGGTSAPALPASPVAPPALPLTTPRLAVFGDSHAQYNQFGSGSAYNRPSGLMETAWAADPRFNFDWWLSATSPLFSGADGALQGLGGDHLDFTNNGGSNATFVDGCLNRTTYAINRAPQIVWVSCGTNSISSGDNSQQPSSAAYVIAKLDAIVGQFTSRGIWVILPTEYPRGDWPVGDARHRTVLAVNDWIRAQAGRTGVKVYDAYAALLDPADPTGTMPNPALFQEGAAGVHVNAAGAWLVYSQFLKPVLQSMIAPTTQFVTDPTAATNLASSALLLNTGSAGTKSGTPTPTGAVPTALTLANYRGTSTMAASIENDGAYSRMVVDVTPVNDSYAQPYHEFTVGLGNTGKPLTANIPAGSWVRMCMGIETSPAAQSASIIRANLVLRNAAGTILTGQSYWHTEASSAFALAAPGRGFYWLCSKPQTISDIATQFNLNTLEVYWPKAMAAPFEVKIGPFVINQIPDPRTAWNLP